MKEKDIIRYLNKDGNWKIDPRDKDEIGFSAEKSISKFSKIFIEFFSNDDRNIERIEFVHPHIPSDVGGCASITLMEENLEYFTYIVNLFSNKSTMEIQCLVLKKYLDALERFKKLYEPILTKYNFFSETCDVIDCTRNREEPFKFCFYYCLNNKTCHVIKAFEYTFLEDTIKIWIDGGEPIDLFMISPSEFEKIFISDLEKDERTEYLLSEDPKMTENSYKIYSYLKEAIYAKRENRNPTLLFKELKLILDPEQIPDKWKDVYEIYLELTK